MPPNDLVLKEKIERERYEYNFINYNNDTNSQSV